MRWMLAILTLAGQAWAGGVESWPSRDVDLGRIYTAPDGWSAVVLVTTVHAYAAPLEEWFEPRVVALPGEGLTADASRVERLPSGAIQQRLILGGNAPPTDVVVTAYETPAGNQMLVTVFRTDGAADRGEEAAAYVAAHVAASDVWTGEGWQKATPLAPMDTTGLECRMEQQPSVVWVINWACRVECPQMCEAACGLEPTSAMTLIDAQVCREPR